MYDYFAIFGMVVAGALVIAIVVLGGLILSIKLIVHFPRVHVGAPQNPMETITYDAREILTTKPGEHKAPTGRGDIIQQLALRWWLGISSRNSARWFFGVIRWDIVRNHPQP